MSKSVQAIILIGLLGTSVLSVPVVRIANSPKYFVSFGDSYTQSGFDVVNGAMPNPANPFGNPTPGQGTASGGKMWLHYLSMNYNTSLTYAYNFAYGGATTDEQLVPAFATSVKSVKQQLFDEFLPNLAKEPFVAEDTIFSLFIGINEYLPKIMAQRSNITDTLYKTGARHFLFQNIPPIDRTPQVINGGTYWAQMNKDWVTGYNNALKQFSKDFKMKYPDVTVYDYDLWHYFTKVLDNPTRYGFTSAISQSQDGGLPNLWFGDYHPGYAFDNLWAKQLSKTFKFFQF